MNIETASALAVELSHSAVDSHLANRFSVQFALSNSAANTPLKIVMPDLAHAHSSEQWLGLVPNRDWSAWYLFQNRDYLFARVPAALTRSQPLDEAAETSYLALFDCMHQLGYPYLCRTWNYFSDITHAGPGTHNRYQLFCSGRSRAYQSCAQSQAHYPAATVVGSHNDDLCVYFIASKRSGSAIENSNQISAYNYPKQYSQDAPLFARALLHQTSQQTILFISGTASIRGHASQYANDVRQQTGVCLDNIQTLIDTAKHEHNLDVTSLSELTLLKVYIKRRQDFTTVKTLVEAHCGSQLAVSYLQGHLCRDDLLVEIEAVCIKKH